MNLSIITRVVGAVRLAAKAHAPTIMVTTGVVSMAAGTVVACKNTLKLEETLEPHAYELEQKQLQTGNNLNDDQKLVLAKAAGFDVVKLYIVPSGLFIGGAGLVFSGHRIMLKRNATLAIAFTGLKQAFDAYRGRVVKTFGHEVDQGMMNGYVAKEVYDDETGGNKVVYTRDWDESAKDPYNRVFEQGATTQWEPDIGINKMFIAHQQMFAQQLLNQRGYLWLSEVYEALGFPENDISRIVGWKVKRLPDGTRDIPQVDFGLDKPHPDDWKYEGKGAAIYLDFNCQGLIVGGQVQKILEKA